MDEALNRKMGTVFGPDGEIYAPFEEDTFTKIEEKMVVEVTLKVLQNQQVKMQKHVCKHDEDKDNHHDY